MRHPYDDLPSDALWRTAVADPDPFDIAGMAKGVTQIAKTDAVATAGSCFAQHISRRLRTNGFRFVDVEPAPPGLEQRSAEFGYGLYSARYGNIYTSRQLVQLLGRAIGKFKPQDNVWQTNGRFYDPFRPSIEPGGFSSAEEMLEVQAGHLQAVKRMFKRANVFVYTMGLTETWIDRADGAAYPTCPGTIAGHFDSERHAFVNLTHAEVMADMKAFLKRVWRINPGLRVILTVSPVPLTATASGQHVLPATTYSKSVLRAVAGELSATYPNVSYFPSYEIITAPVFGGQFFESNQRSVKSQGVDFVMKTFFREVCEVPADTAAPARKPRKPVLAKPKADDFEVLCDEERLDPVMLR